MNNGFKKILLVTDGAATAKSAEQSALNIALRDGSEVIIADTIRLQHRVEKWLIRNSEEMFTPVRERETDTIKPAGNRIFC